MPGEENKDPSDLSKNPQFQQLMGVVTQLGKSFQTLTATLQTQGGNIDKLSKAIETGLKPNGGTKPEDKPPTDKEVDEMSQAQLAAHIFKGVRGMLTESQKELHTKLEGLSTSFEKNNLMTEVEKVRGAHKDFNEWVPEIKEKMTANPGLSLDDAYTLVRKANPEKSKEMDDKYKVGLDDDKSKDKDKTPFGGLLPTSGGSKLKDDEGKDVKLTKAEAGAKAWDEVFGDNPSLAGPDEAD